MNIFVLSFRVHLISCMLLCALCSLCNEHKMNIKEDNKKCTGGYNHWTGLQDWTTGLTQTAKYTSFSVEQKLKVLISSVTLLTLLPTASFLEFPEVKGHVHTI